MNTATANDTIPCQHCGNFHIFKCPLVKAIEYFQNGMTKRIEFFAPNDCSMTIISTPAVPEAEMVPK